MLGQYACIHVLLCDHYAYCVLATVIVVYSITVSMDFECANSDGLVFVSQHVHVNDHIRRYHCWLGTSLFYQYVPCTRCYHRSHDSMCILSHKRMNESYDAHCSKVKLKQDAS